MTAATSAATAAAKDKAKSKDADKDKDSDDDDDDDATLATAAAMVDATIDSIKLDGDFESTVMDSGRHNCNKSNAGGSDIRNTWPRTACAKSMIISTRCFPWYGCCLPLAHP